MLPRVLIGKNLHSAHSTFAVAIDLSHAFNTVNHEILITEISKLELNGHLKRFLSGYLRGRQTYVLFCDQKSNYRKMKQGVPQDTPSFIRIIPTVYDSDRSPDCGQSPHTTTHIFNCPAKPTTMTARSILNNPIDMAIHLGLKTGQEDDSVYEGLQQQQGDPLYLFNSGKSAKLLQ